MRFLADLRYADMPSDFLYKAKLRLLDTIDCIVADPCFCNKIVAAYDAKASGCYVIGTPLLATSLATKVNI